MDYESLWWAELARNVPNVKKITDYAKHVDVNAEKNKKTALTIAIEYRNIYLIRKLIELGADPNRVIDGVPTFFNAVKWTLSKESLLMLKELGPIDTRLTDNMGNNVLFFLHKYSMSMLKKEDEYPLLDYLIAKGADPFYTFLGFDIIDMVIKKGYYINMYMAYFFNKGVSVVKDDHTRLYDIYELNIYNEKVITIELINIINTMVKYHSNIDDYMYDITQLISKGYASKQKKEIIQYLIELGANVNAVYRDKQTPLIKCVIGTNTYERSELMAAIQLLLDAGADPAHKDGKGKRAADYTTDPELLELLDVKPWTGFSRADITFTNDIFHQVTDRNLAISNPGQSLFSMCPICLKYIEHETGSCMYMTHSCVEIAGSGYYHKKLWNAFSYEKDLFDGQGNPAGKKRVVEWCTLCGRICQDHKHYDLSVVYMADKTIAMPPLFPSGDFFAIDCNKPSIGGGGIKEKINRYRRFREVVLFMNTMVGKITMREALNKVVEQMWEAPLAPRNLEVNYALKEKKFNNFVGNDRFPIPVVKNNVYTNVPYPNANLLPTVYPEATDTMRNATEDFSGDTENIVRFRHRMADGTVNEHAGPFQQIALDGLMNYISSMLSQQSEAFGKCWQFSDSIATMYPEGANPPKCTAKLYPEELLKAIEASELTPEIREKYMKLYNSYKIGFNKKFGTTGGKHTRKSR